MKPNIKIFFHVTTVILIAMIIIIFPSIYFRIQENQYINVKKKTSIEEINITKSKSSMLDMSKRIEMIQPDNNEVQHLSLKTGDKYSLFEARNQCFRELSKIPVLKIDVYGPTLNQINIVPEIVIDPLTPAYFLLVWRGTLEIDGILYEVILDEDSEMILQIKVAEHFKSSHTSLQKKLTHQWEKYFFEKLSEDTSEIHLHDKISS